MQPHTKIPVDDIFAARERIKDLVLRTPLVRLEGDNLPAEIFLKLENLQPINSFKLRGASNAIALARAGPTGSRRLYSQCRQRCPGSGLERHPPGSRVFNRGTRTGP